MADSEKRTGEETIGKITKEMLFECYTTDDVQHDYNNLRTRLDSEGTNNRDFAQLLKLVWEFTMSKPKQSIGLEADREISININEGTTKDDRPQPGV